MHKTLIPALALALVLMPAAARKSDSAFSQPLSKDQKIQQALNRLTFGPRPGDFERVQKMGLKKWLDLQLHPDRIAENPVLASKLAPLDTLRMSPEQLVRDYPPPQVVRAMVAGRLPFPTDPARRAMIQRLVARFDRQMGKDTPGFQKPGLQQVLSEQERRTLRSVPPVEKIAFFRSLPEDRQDRILEAMPAGMRNQLFAAAPPALRRRIEMFNGPQVVVAQDLMEAKLYRAVYGNRQLEEVLTDFWFNHFNVFLDKGADRYLVAAYERDAIRPHVLGKFQDLLVATAKSPAMLFYLDNWQSVDPQFGERAARRNPRAARRGLNENYGRELMELHTLGVNGGYTQKDVTEVARCFTGWTIQRPQQGGGFIFNPRLHDNGEKVVLGVRIPAGGGMEDGLKVLDILAHRPATAHHISLELARRFVSDNPPPALVDRMAKTFLAKDGDLREVLKTMFRSPEFCSQGAFRSKMKSPLELVASALRASGADVQFGLALENQLNQMGEPLYRKQEPTGYANTGAQWDNSAGLLARMNFALALAANQVPGVKVAPDANVAGLELGSPEFQKH